MMRSDRAVSSSSVMNMVPFAVPGRCRNNTNPATLTHRRCGVIRSSRTSRAVRTHCLSNIGRKNDNGCAFSDNPTYP